MFCNFKIKAGIKSILKIVFDPTFFSDAGHILIETCSGCLRAERYFNDLPWRLLQSHLL